MRESDGTSWRFTEDVAELPHLALYLRDAVRLPVPDAPDLPPRLDAPIPDRSEVLGAADLPAAAAQWARWWAAIIDAEARSDDQPPSAGADPHEAARARLRAAGDARRPVLPEPPDFAALTDFPELQRAVAATFTEATRLVSKHRRNLLFHDRPAQIPWVLLSGVAEQVATDRAVPTTALHGRVEVLMVQGSWWTLHSPGVALASVAAARDRGVATELVTRVFTSALDGATD